jgi:arylsulfatase
MSFRFRLFALMSATCIGVGGVLAWIALSSDARAPGKPRSVILITLDTLRADRLSSSGYVRKTSPNLDAFFERGTRFAHAFSTAPNTVPSHTAMLTGLYPGFTSVWKMNGQLPLSSDAVTLAELSREAGLRTAAVVSNAVLTRSLGLAQGFESYDDDMRDVEMNRPWAEQIAEHATPKVLAKLEELRNAPFFLWAHFQDPHGPYAPPGNFSPTFAEAETDGSDSAELPVGTDQSGYRAIPQYQVFRDERRVHEYQRRYDAEIAYLDRTLKPLFDTLVTTGLLNETLVIITSDHGEAFGEDGFYFAHGHSSGLDQLHVPLAFIGPGVTAGVVRQRPVSNIAIFCTVVDALELATASACSPGMSLWPALTAGEEPPERAWFAGSVTQWAVLPPGIFFRRDAVSKESSLFTEVEPGAPSQFIPLGEQFVPLAGSSAKPDANATRLLLDQFAADAEAARQRLASRKHSPAKISAQHAEWLRALGYLEKE